MPRPVRRRPKFKDKGVATSVELSGQPLTIKQKRPTVNITQQKGFAVRVKKTGTKGRKLVI